ncbi:MAG: hypothetical protein M1829_002016 [Trizodia sp. TS-e1964]|nr:MAG: hypothetical protein M1829_002016 [Trizodia sp. TS-e1964]
MAPRFLAWKSHERSSNDGLRPAGGGLRSLLSRGPSTENLKGSSNPPPPLLPGARSASPLQDDRKFLFENKAPTISTVTVADGRTSPAPSQMVGGDGGAVNGGGGGGGGGGQKAPSLNSDISTPRQFPVPYQAPYQSQYQPAPTSHPIEASRQFTRPSYPASIVSNSSNLHSSTSPISPHTSQQYSSAPIAPIEEPALELPGSILLENQGYPVDSVARWGKGPEKFPTSLTASLGFQPPTKPTFASPSPNRTRSLSLDAGMSTYSGHHQRNNSVRMQSLLASPRNQDASQEPKTEAQRVSFILHRSLHNMEGKLQERERQIDNLNEQMSQLKQSHEEEIKNLKAAHNADVTSYQAIIRILEKNSVESTSSPSTQDRPDSISSSHHSIPLLDHSGGLHDRDSKSTSDTNLEPGTPSTANSLWQKAWAPELQKAIRPEADIFKGRPLSEAVELGWESGPLTPFPEILVTEPSVSLLDKLREQLIKQDKREVLLQQKLEMREEQAAEGRVDLKRMEKKLAEALKLVKEKDDMLKMLDDDLATYKKDVDHMEDRLSFYVEQNREAEIRESILKTKLESAKMESRDSAAAVQALQDSITSNQAKLAELEAVAAAAALSPPLPPMTTTGTQTIPPKLEEVVKLAGPGETPTIPQLQAIIKAHEDDIALYKLDVRGYKKDVRARDAMIKRLETQILDLEAQIQSLRTTGGAGQEDVTIGLDIGPRGLGITDSPISISHRQNTPTQSPSVAAPARQASNSYPNSPHSTEHILQAYAMPASVRRSSLIHTTNIASVANPPPSPVMLGSPRKLSRSSTSRLSTPISKYNKSFVDPGLRSPKQSSTST